MSTVTIDRFRQLKAGVIVPTYNNAGTLGKLLSTLFHYTDRVIVVNDGSTDATSGICSSFPNITLVSYAKNMGKGWALRSGFKKARELGWEHAITIDSDGQHFPEDLPAFLDMLEREPGTLIIGKRNMTQDGIPGKSSFGNNFSNFWYRVETGYRMEDTQCGYRLYPIKALEHFTFLTRKFEFEIEVIVRAAWSGIPIGAVPVKIHYDEKEKRISHFRPFRDFTRISILNTFLVAIAFLYIKPRNFIRQSLGLTQGQTLSQQISQESDSNLKKSISIGVGVFMGIVPIWGFQLITAIALAFLLRLNKLLVILAANISIPPFLPFILYLSHLTGAIFMGTQATALPFSKGITIESLRESFTQYIAGAIALSVLAGLLSGCITFLILHFTKKAEKA